MRSAPRNPDEKITSLLRHRRLLLLACFLRLKNNCYSIKKTKGGET